MTDIVSDLRRAETQLAEAQSLLVRCVEFIDMMCDDNVDAYENSDGELIFTADLVADIRAVL